jgi:hypothetical protein
MGRGRGLVPIRGWSPPGHGLTPVVPQSVAISLNRRCKWRRVARRSTMLHWGWWSRQWGQSVRHVRRGVTMRLGHRRKSRGARNGCRRFSYRFAKVVHRAGWCLFGAPVVFGPDSGCDRSVMGTGVLWRGGRRVGCQLCCGFRGMFEDPHVACRRGGCCVVGLIGELKSV